MWSNPVQASQASKTNRAEFARLPWEKPRVRIGARLYFAASMVAQGSALIRYVILARILGPEELGLAAMLVLTAQFFESISDTGADRFVVQDPDGGEPRMVGLVHLAMSLRGVMIAVLLALTAGLAARLYGAPQITPALQVLALAPLIAGFTNYDMRRAQRSGDFRPESYVTIVGEVIGVGASAAAAIIVRDHTAVLYGLITRAVVMLAMSHAIAKHRYAWAFGRQESRRFFTFAGPLAINGLFLYFGSQGDRLLVASGLGAAALGQYSAILLLIFNPTSAVARFLQGIHLPHVARARDDAPALLAQGDQIAGQSLLLAVGAVVGFALAGPFLAPLLYGKLGAQPLLMFAGLGAVQAARLLRGWPTAIALGLGRSGDVMINNIVRVIALPVAFVANLHWHVLTAILAAFFLGEFLALIGGLWLLIRQSAAPLRSSVRRTGMFVATSAATVTFAAASQFDHRVPQLLAAAALLALLVAVCAQEKATLGEARDAILARLRRRGPDSI